MKDTLFLFILMFYYLVYTHFNIASYFIFLFSFSFILLGICLILSENNSYFEKNTSYECGFDPFSDTKSPFDVKFYLIAILFIIFDIEIIFFLIWAVCQKELYIIGYYIIYLFFFILLLGFFYEIRKNSLDWN